MVRAAGGRGLLRAVLADERTWRLRANAALCAVVIGEVVPKRDKSLWVK